MIVLMLLLQVAGAAPAAAPSSAPPARQGVTRIAYDVTEAGRAENCVVTASSGNAALDAKACSVMTDKGRFVPAKGADGKPIRSRQTFSVTWRPGG